MRLRILSDLHLETLPWTYKPHGEDAVILAGDICSRSIPGRERRNHLLASIDAPVLYVLGNHEFYGPSNYNTHGKAPKAVAATRQATTLAIQTELSCFPHVHLLNDSSVTLDGIRFYGTTLWTDFTLPHPRVSRSQLMSGIHHAVRDFECILGATGKPLQSEEMATWANTAKAELTSALTINTPTVVITHFMPSALSINERYYDEPLNGYFCCPVDNLIVPPVIAWVHGHTHSACHYHVGSIPVICNPRGYPDENTQYDSDLMLDIP